MLQFMISGYIPGTDRQLNFYEFIVVASLGAIAYLTYLFIKERRILQQLAVKYVLREYL